MAGLESRSSSQSQCEFNNSMYEYVVILPLHLDRIYHSAKHNSMVLEVKRTVQVCQSHHVLALLFVELTFLPDAISTETIYEHPPR